MISKIKSWFTFPEDFLYRIGVGIMATVIFCLGILAGAAIATISIKTDLYNEAMAADDAIWIRIDEIDGKKGDLMERVDKLSRIMDQYDLAVAQIKVYEARQEIMNVRISGED